MKRKIFCVFFAVVLVVSFSLVTAVPVSAVGAGYSLHTMGTGIAEWSTPEANFGSYSVKLDTGISPGPTDFARIIVPIGDKTLSEVASVSYWAKVTATAEPLERYRPWVGIYLDDPVGGDGDPSTYEYYIQAEPMYAYPSGAFPYTVPSNWELWDSDDAEHPLRWLGLESPDYPYEAPLLSDYIDGWAVSYTTPEHGVQSFASREYGSLTVIKITFMAGWGTNWENFTGYVDDFTINGETYVLELPPEPLTVDDDRVENPDAYFQTIQGAVDCASLGDTINVAAGTYEENVVVNETLTLQGEDRGTTEIKFGYDFYPSTSPLTISADGVTVSGFTIRSGPYIEPAWTIMVEGNSALLTDLNVIKDALLDSSDRPRIGGAAVYLTPGLDGFNFTHSIVDSAWNGIYAPRNPGSSNIVVRDVDFTYPGEYAILLMMVTGATIEESTFTCTGHSIADKDSNGIVITRGSNAIEIRGRNQFIGSQPVLARNHIGILLQAYADGTMGSVGILSNEISGFNTGILVEDVDTSGISIHYNSIVDNTYGVNNQATMMVDATNNWWGDATGSDPDTEADNPHGTAAAGDKVSGNVHFMPWYATATTTPDTEYVSVEHSSILAYSDTIQGGIDAALIGDTVNVAAGTYNPMSTIVINKDTLTLLGPQPDVDPRPSYDSTRTAGSPAEAMIDGGPNSLGVIIAIDADNVVINGLEVKSGTGDMIKQNTPHSGTTVKYCIIHDGLGDEGVQLKKCTNGVLEYNYVYDIASPGDALNISDGSSNGSIRYNEVYDIGTENAAIYVYGSTNMEIVSNLVYHVTQNDGIKLGAKNGSDATLTGGSILDNIVYDTAQDGISVYMSGVSVEGNEVYNSSSENGAIYLAWAISDITIQNNSVHDNVLQTGKYADAAGILVGVAVDASTVTINFNNIYNNSPYGVTNHAPGIVDATNNWWGANDGPSASPGSGDKISANVDADPWLVIGIRADPAGIEANGTSASTITADMTKNSGGEDTSDSGHIPDGTQITFRTSKGSIGSQEVNETTTDGIAIATLTSSATVETATVTASAPPHTPAATATTAVFFTKSGVTVEDSESEKTETGDDTVDATDEADTKVDKSGTGTPTITAAKYSSNPGTGFSGDIGKYVDVHIDSDEGVDEIVIKVYYTSAEIAGRAESSLRLRWWNGTSWVACSDSGVDTTDIVGPPAYSGYMWAKVRSDTVPTLAQLSGTVFGGHGGTAPPPPPPTVILESIAASPSSLTLGVDETQQLTVTATYSDESTADVTAEASYESSDTSVATSDAGLITGVAEGSAAITVSYTEDEIEATDTVSVTVIVFTPWGYDADGDGVIDKSEAIDAVVDYFDGFITKDQALEVIALYFG